MSAWQHPFEIEIVVSPDAIDALGHVNNAVYLQYAELAARQHSDAEGFTLDWYREKGAAPVVRRHEIQYLAPAHAGERLVVTTSVVGLAGVRARRKTEIRGPNGICAEVDTDWVWVDLKTSRPVRIQPEILANSRS